MDTIIIICLVVVAAIVAGIFGLLAGANRELRRQQRRVAVEQEVAAIPKAAPAPDTYPDGCTYRSHDGRVFTDIAAGREHDRQIRIAGRLPMKRRTHVYDPRRNQLVPRCGEPGSPYLWGSRDECERSFGL